MKEMKANLYELREITERMLAHAHELNEGYFSLKKFEVCILSEVVKPSSIRILLNLSGNSFA